MSFELARTNMISQQLRTCNIYTETLLDTMKEIPRHAFVPEQYQHWAYSDTRIPLGHGEFMMMPMEEALLVQALDLNKNKIILEIGTGSAYLTALLAKQAKHVISVEYHADFIQEASKKLKTHGIENVTLIHANGSRGYPELAPYDAIIISGAIPKLELRYALQLLKQGRLVTILGKQPVMQACLSVLDASDIWHTQFLFSTQVTPLIDEHQKSNFIF